MNCPKCNTWNPDDKNVCWRCQTQLPRPEPKKQRRAGFIFGLPYWLFILMALMILVPFLGQCALQTSGG